MIKYKELSTLCFDLGLSARALYSVSNCVGKHYRAVQIPKLNGALRRLTIPDSFLKTIQVRIYEKLLVQEPISRYAAGYRPGGSTLVNASPHIGQPVLLKLDIRHFFDSLIYPLVKDAAFPAERYSESNRILLAILCTYRGILPQGAPTSPAISNIMMRDFDNRIGEWCAGREIRYTRYCDDMTFSGDFDPAPVIVMVASELKLLGLYLNTDKTVVARKGQKKIVTGIVVNEKLSVPREYKRRLRQELHYCMKFGLVSHTEHRHVDIGKFDYALSLLGRVNYVLSIEIESVEFRQYRAWLKAEIKRISQQ